MSSPIVTTLIARLDGPITRTASTTDGLPLYNSIKMFVSHRIMIVQARLSYGSIPGRYHAQPTSQLGRRNQFLSAAFFRFLQAGWRWRWFLQNQELVKNPSTPVPFVYRLHE